MLGDLLAVLFLILAPGCLLVFWNDFLARRREEDFLGALEEILSKDDKKE